MAALENDHLVVRVAYTGPPMAGKTESVRALLPLLNGKGTSESVMSPGEWRGRTAFFDWAYYEGGAFEGRPIRCQIISTPGQVALSDRRELILRSADAVILVVESQLEAIERALQCYEEMAPWLEEAGGDTPIRVLLACNKQDLEGSVPPEELSQALGLPFGKEVYPTSARTGKGLRAAFVAGVRVAVERARALLAKGQVLSAPAVRTGEELYELMQRDAASRSLASPHGTPPSLRSSPPSERTTRRVLSSAPSQGTAGSSVRAAARSRSAPTSRPPWSRLLSGRPPEAPSAAPSATNANVPAPESAPIASTPASTPAASTPVAAPPAAAPPASTPVASRPSTKRPASTPVASAPRPVPTEPPRASIPAVAAATRTSSPAALSAPLPVSGDRAAARDDQAAARAEAALERAPQSSTRHAIPPTRSLLIESKAPELPAIIEVRAAAQATLRLDPAGKAARAWRPESGARPAVMPASAYYALVVPAYEPGASVQTPLAPRRAQATPDRRAPQSQGNINALTAPALSRTTSYVPGGTRPAVMPAAAYFATLPPAERSPDVNAFTSSPFDAMAARPASTQSAPRRRPSPGARPAVMPASAYYAALGAIGAAADGKLSHGSAGDGTTGNRSGDALTAMPAAHAASPSPARAGLNVKAPSAKPTPGRRGLDPGARPAVMPASVWRAALGLQPSAVHDGAPSLGSAASAASTGAPQTDAPLSSVPRTFSAHPAQAANQTGTSRVPMRLLAGGSPPQPRADTRAPAAPARTPLELVKRPAVMPASAWLGKGSALSTGIGAPQAQVPSAKRQGRPAVMPASAWRALQQMPAAASGASASPALLDDPPTLPSAALEKLPIDAPSDGTLLEPSESFWIPETPPGLRGLTGSAAPRIFSAGESTAHSAGAPRLPGQARAPSAVWRRTTWRALETQITEEGRALEDAHGRWIGELAPGWYARTLSSATDSRAARRAFAEAVLRHRRLSRYLSEPRCLALTEEADRFWIWQIACRVPTLGASLGRLLALGEGPSAMADALIEAAEDYLTARESFAEAPEPLPLSLLTLGSRDGRSVYAGLMPDTGAAFASACEDSDAAFADALQKKWRDSPEPAVSTELLLLELSSKAVGRLPDTLLDSIRAALVQN